MQTTYTKKDRDIIMVPDQPARKAPDSASPQEISFESAENSSLSSNLSISRALPAPEYFAPIYEITKLNPESSKLKHTNLLKMLGKFGEFPDKYRGLIWRYLLALPLNKPAYEGLLRLGIHPAYKDLRKKYPIESQRLFCRTQRILSALGHWAPFTCEIEYLPSFVFPFVKMIEHDDLVLFEVIMSMLTHWCQTWFVAYPQPPVHLLQLVEDVIHKEDPELWTHFRRLGFHPVQYAWPLLQSMFSEVLPKPHWAAVMDHVIAAPSQPQLVFCFAAAYLLQLRTSFLTISTAAQLAASTRTLSPLDIKRLIKKAKELLPQMSGDRFPETYANKLPISAPGLSSYPILGGYPKYVVEVGSQIRRQIMDREQDILKQKHLVKELQEHNQKLLEQELRLREQQEGALYAEKEQAAQRLAEAEVEILERKSLANKEKAKRLTQIKELESKLSESLSLEDKLRKMQEDRLASTYNQRRAVARQDAEERQELEEMRTLEYKATEKAAELLKLRQSQSSSRSYAAEEDLRRIENEEKALQVDEKYRAEDQEGIMKREMWMRENEAALAAERQEQMQVLKEKEEEIRRKERELQLEKMEHERTMRRMAEEQVYSEPRSSTIKGSQASMMRSGSAQSQDERSPAHPPSVIPADRYDRPQSLHEDLPPPPPQRYEEEAGSSRYNRPREPSTSNLKASQKSRSSNGERETVKMSVHDMRENTTAGGEPFTFKNTAAETGILQDATRKIWTSDVYARPPPVEDDKFVAETQQPHMEHHTSAGFGAGPSEYSGSSHSPKEITAAGSMEHAKNFSYPTPMAHPELLERHNRVKQQLEEMQKRFGHQSAELPSQPGSGAKSGEKSYEKSSEVSSSSVYTSSKGESPSGVGESPEDKYGLSSGTSISESSKEDMSPPKEQQQQ